MRWRELVGASVLLATTVASAGAAFGDSMRCGRYVVQTGHPQSRVLEACGEPRHAWQDGFIEQTIRRNDGYYPAYPHGYYPAYPPPPYPLPGYETEYRRIIPVYKWEYNLGRGTLLKTLIFHGDTLMEIVDGPRQ